MAGGLIPLQATSISCRVAVDQSIRCCLRRSHVFKQTGCIIKRERIMAIPFSAMLGGVDWRPKAFLRIPSTTIIFVKEVTSTARYGRREAPTNTRMIWEGFGKLRVIEKCSHLFSSYTLFHRHSGL